MSAIRQVVESATIPLNPSDVRRHNNRLSIRRGNRGGNNNINSSSNGFHVSLPMNIIEGQKDQRHVEDIWSKNVCPTITKLCYARTSRFINKNIRRTAFHSSMDNICQEFNRKTLNIKIEFQILNSRSTNQQDDEQQQQSSSSKNNNNNNSKTSMQKYALRISKLSDISDSILNAGQYCTAEIPYRPPDPVEAELIGPREEDNHQEEEDGVNNTTSSNVSSTDTDTDAVGIVIDFVEDYDSQQARTRTTGSSTMNGTSTNNNSLLPPVVINNSPDPSLENVPILSAVAVVFDDDDDDGGMNEHQAAMILREEEEEDVVMRNINNNNNNNNNSEFAASPPPLIATAAAAYVETIIP